MRMVDEARKHVVCTLVNAEHYKELLGSTPNRRYGRDILLLYRVISKEPDTNKGSLSVLINWRTEDMRLTMK